MSPNPQEIIYCAALAVLALLAAANDMHAEQRDAQSGAIVTAEIVERAR